MTAGIAHDFNNLLTVVIGNVDRAKRRIAEPDEASRALEAARTGAERAAVLTQRLLAFGRNHPHDLRKVDVNDFVRRERPKHWTAHWARKSRSSSIWQQIFGRRRSIPTNWKTPCSIWR